MEHSQGQPVGMTSDTLGMMREIVALRADALRELTRERGWTMSQLADAATLSHRTIVKVVQGRPVTRSTARLIAEALGLSLADLVSGAAIARSTEGDRDQYQSVFISYGGPDTDFASRLFRRLSQEGVTAFFFPESAVPGKKLHRTMANAISEFDRVLLVCSESSLARPGVLNEIEQVLQREAAEGGEELLIPLALDDSVFVKWQPDRIDLRAQILSRVVADFRGAHRDGPEFDSRFARLLRAIRLDQ